MKKVLIIGASGMVGSRFCDLASKKFEIIRADEKTLDVTNKTDVEKYFRENSDIDSVVNFAAFTNVDGAEAQRGNEKGLVWQLNVEGPKNLTGICRKYGKFLVHISTDFVFPGTVDDPGPYSEDARLPSRQDDIGWYAWTKRMAEDIVKGFAIVRYGYPFRADSYELKLDWARNNIKLFKEGKLYPLFTDQIQSLLFIDDLVEPLAKIIDEKLTGVFHIASCDTTTPFEANSYLLEKYSGKKVEVQKGSMTEFLKSPGRTPRPRLGGLKVEKTEKILGLKFRTWQEMIDEFISQLATS